jgi:hypothetical protein
MMKKLLFLTFILLITSNMPAQEKSNTLESCASEILYKKMLESNPSLLAKKIQFEETVKKHKVTAKSAATTYVIPVVVHVMHKGEALGTGTNISDEQIFTKIKIINEEFRKIKGSLGDGAGVDIGIEFALAVRNPSGQTTNGINRFSMTSNAAYMNNGVNSTKTSGINDSVLKKLIVWNSNLYYNIWLVSEIDNNDGGAGLQGYAMYAPMHGDAQDGAVILSNSFKDLNSTTEAHELGHAFNLLHTFEGDRSGTTPICPSGDGDYCADTPPHQRETNDCSSIGTNSCDSGSSNTSFVNNYMSYSYNSCRNMFTNDQKNRIITALTTLRSSFLSQNSMNNLVPVSTPVASFIPAVATLLNTGESIAFSDTSKGVPNTYLTGSNWTGMTFVWTLTNGTTTLTSTEQNPTFTFTVPGDYAITHTATNALGSNTITTTNLIHVTNSTIAPPSKTTSQLTGNYGYTVNYVNLNTISKYTDAHSNTPYSDFSATDKTTLISENSYSLKMTAKSGNQYQEFVAVYIDYNNNNVFEESEKIGTISIPAVSALTDLIADFTLPADAVKNTLLRMRIAGNANTGITNNMINGIDKFFVGDVKDFGIYITDAPVVTLGIDAISSAGIQSSFYPNPVKDILNINSKNDIERVEIYNILGQLVHAEKCNNSNLDNAAKQIDLSKLGNGMYIITLYSNNEKSSFKILKN